MNPGDFTLMLEGVPVTWEVAGRKTDIQVTKQEISDFLAKSNEKIESNEGGFWDVNLAYNIDEI
jgi:hypothetical protein